VRYEALDAHTIDTLNGSALKKPYDLALAAATCHQVALTGDLTPSHPARFVLHEQGHHGIDAVRAASVLLIREHTLATAQELLLIKLFGPLQGITLVRCAQASDHHSWRKETTHLPVA
jgi:hypothetical protein